MTVPAEIRYIRAALTFTECDAMGVPLPGAAVSERSDHIAIAAMELTHARSPAAVWAYHAEHVAQYVMLRRGVEETTKAFGELMVAGRGSANKGTN